MKSMLAVQGIDGERKAVCPDCKSELIWRDLGITQYVSGGELVEQDHGGFWECSNKKCGYQEE